MKPMFGKDLDILRRTALRLISKTPTNLNRNPLFKKITPFITDPVNIRFKEHIKCFTRFFEKNFGMIQTDKYLIINVIEDDTLLIEWIFPNFRFGFSMEKDLNESSYYFISKKNYGETTVSGLINDTFGDDLIKVIVKKIF